MKRWSWLALVLLVVGCAVQPTTTVYLPLVTDAEQWPVLGIGQHYQYVDCDRLRSLKARWAYDWSLTPQDCEGIEGVPMFWDGKHLGEPVNSNHLLWFNEPDVGGQSNLTPQAAADLWNQHRPKYNAQRNGSPGVFSLWWLREWLPLVDIKPDFLAVHPYQFFGTFEQAQAGFVAYLNDADALAQQYGLNYWLTEYAWVTDSPRQAEWLTWSLGEIKRHSRIERAAWFVDWCTGDEPWAFPVTTNLCNDDGSLTGLGLAWTNAGDVNADGCVDILDLVIVGASYGKGCD